MEKISLHHYLRAIQIRTSLLREVRYLKKIGYTVPAGIRRRIWKEPHIHEEYIWFLRFIGKEERITLIDIGGNSGYWAKDFLYYFPKAKVYGFEPVSMMFAAYKSRFMGNENVKIFNTALGEQNAVIEINVAEGFGKTSFLKYGGFLSYENESFTKTENVTVHLLDDYFDKINFDTTVIKVDVQGFEEQVIRGGMKVFEKADIAFMECSFVDMYKDRLPSFGTIVSELRKLDLHPVTFAAYDTHHSPIAYERNVTFIKSKYFSQIWNEEPAS